MRAGGREAGRARGGTGSPRGPFLRFRACARKRPSLAFMGRLCARAPFRARGPAARGLFCVPGGAFSCAWVSSAFWGIMHGYESAIAITSP